MTIWWPRGHHYKMMTMVILVVIPWSSYDDHGHHSKMMTTSGDMVIILVECSPECSPHSFKVKDSVCLFLFFLEFSNAPAQPCRQILCHSGLLSLFAAVKGKEKTATAFCGYFLLVSVDGIFSPVTTTPHWYWECFDTRPWGYAHINARCICAKLSGGLW